MRLPSLRISDAATGAASLVRATVFGQMVGFAVLPILTRLVSPDSLVTFAVGVAPFGMVLAIDSLRHEQAIRGQAHAP